MAMVMVAAVLDGTDDEDDDDNDDVQHDVKDDPIVDSRRRLEHNIMSSTTGSRHNCEQGQGYSPPQQRNNRGGGERHHHRPHPTGGAGGIPWGGGEGGCGSPASYMHIYVWILKRVYTYFIYID